jgi:hypothetical protein
LLEELLAIFQRRSAAEALATYVVIIVSSLAHR